MGNKLSTFHMASNSQDVTLEQFQYVIPSDDPLRSDVINFPVKLVPVTKLLANADQPDYNTFTGEAGYIIRFVVKIGKGLKGKLRFHAGVRVAVCAAALIPLLRQVGVCSGVAGWHGLGHSLACKREDAV
jgi:hypothetical protein